MRIICAVVVLVVLGGVQGHASTTAIYDFAGAWLRGPDAVVGTTPRQRFSGTLAYPVDPSGRNGNGSIITLDLFDDQTNVSTFGVDVPLFADVIVDANTVLLQIGGGVEITDPDTENVFVDLPIEDLLSVQISRVALTFEEESGDLSVTRTPPDEIVFSDFGDFGSFRLQTFGDPEFLVGFVDTFALRDAPLPIPLPAGLPLLGTCLVALGLVARAQRRGASHRRRRECDV